MRRAIEYVRFAPARKVGRKFHRKALGSFAALRMTEFLNFGGG